MYTMCAYYVYNVRLKTVKISFFCIFIPFTPNIFNQVALFYLMRYKILGKTGISVSNICLGMMSFGNTQEWHLELDEARPIVDRALDTGINFFDTANVYSRGRSEEITGELLSEHRDDVVIASKIRFKMGEGVNDKGLNRHHMFRQVEESLERLQTDHIDLYQIHRWDNATHVDMVMRSLNQLIDRGVVDHIGASSM